MRWLVLTVFLIGCEPIRESDQNFSEAADNQFNRIICAWDKKHLMCLCGFAHMKADTGGRAILQRDSIFAGPNHACQQKE